MQEVWVTQKEWEKMTMDKSQKVVGHTPGPAEIEFHNWANYAGYVPARVIEAYEKEKESKGSNTP